MSAKTLRLLSLVVAALALAIPAFADYDACVCSQGSYACDDACVATGFYRYMGYYYCDYNPDYPTQGGDVYCNDGYGVTGECAPNNAVTLMCQN